MRNWLDVLPESVAVEQHRWERYMLCARMREFGLTYKQIGIRLGVSAMRARELVYRAERYKKSNVPPPIQQYLSASEFNTPEQAMRFVRQKPRIDAARAKQVAADIDRLNTA